MVHSTWIGDSSSLITPQDYYCESLVLYVLASWLKAGITMHGLPVRFYNNLRDVKERIQKARKRRLLHPAIDLGLV